MLNVLWAAFLALAFVCGAMTGRLSEVSAALTEGAAGAVTLAIGIPQECVSLALLKPISGGGGLALGSELIRTAGPDSYVGRVAAVMLGSSETSIYTIGLYAGHLGLKRTRYAIPAALCADLAAFMMSAALTDKLFPTC